MFWNQVYFSFLIHTIISTYFYNNDHSFRISERNGGGKGLGHLIPRTLLMIKTSAEARPLEESRVPCLTRAEFSETPSPLQNWSWKHVWVLDSTCFFTLSMILQELYRYLPPFLRYFEKTDSFRHFSRWRPKKGVKRGRSVGLPGFSESGESTEHFKPKSSLVTGNLV